VALPWGTPANVLLHRFPHDIGGADAFLPGFGFQLFLEAFIDPDTDAFHAYFPW